MIDVAETHLEPRDPGDLVHCLSQNDGVDAAGDRYENPSAAQREWSEGAPQRPHDR